jgi:large subunit ribosomal protein L17
MRHRVHTFKIGKSGAHRRAMLANMVSSLIEHGEIKTTVTKAKEARRMADKMITLGKKGTLHHRRQAIATLRDKKDMLIIKKLFDEIAPGYAERVGGYTRIIRLGTRRGDAAEMCLLQLVEEGAPTLKKKTTPAAEEAAPVVEVAAEEAAVETAEPVAEEAAVAEEKSEEAKDSKE